LNKFFEPKYSKLLLLLAGVVIGVSISFPTWLLKTALLFVAIGLCIFSDKVKAKEEINLPIAKCKAAKEFYKNTGIDPEE